MKLFFMMVITSLSVLANSGPDNVRLSSIKLDLDGDNILDTVVEKPLDSKNNKIEIYLSKSKKTISFNNILPLPNKGSYCSGTVSNVFKVINTNSFLVTSGKGEKDGCESNYTVERRLFEIRYEEGQFLIDKLTESLDTFAVADAQHSYKMEYRFRDAATDLSLSWGYGGEISWSATLNTREYNCRMPLREYDKNRLTNSCLNSSASRLERSAGTLEDEITRIFGLSF